VKCEALASYLLSFPQASEDQPFGPNVDVYKVVGKMFAILSPEDDPPAITLKCDPLIAIELREEYVAVVPGYHLNKSHWNTVTLDGSVPDQELKKMMSHSYEQVVAGLPKAHRDKIARATWPRI
jgi:predicted DNA-binding protein (MmcQ/YjbR family)